MHRDMSALNELLQSVIDPDTGQPLAGSGRVSGSDLSGAVATIILTPKEADGDAALKRAIEAAAAQLEAIERVRIVFETPKTAGKPRPARESRASEAAKTPPARLVIAVGSGKGGVGKSTVAANLAAACAKAGLKTGLMDADIYGPSAPRLFGLSDAPGLKKSEAGIEPLDAHGVKIVSMGFLVGERDPVVWRGPMVTGAVRQFMDEVNWGDLDILIVDMPPGTGDVQLALAQGTPLTGAVVVCTPLSWVRVSSRRPSS